jgi:hypothetical protein
MVKLKTRIVTYEDMPMFLTDLVDAKNAYQQVIDNGIVDEITDASREDILSAVDLPRFINPIPATAVLYDDAINVFANRKYKILLDLLFQNRQPRITYFLCMQDGFSLPPQIKRNLDTCILFGGYTDSQMISILLRQLNSSSESNKEIAKIYSKLSNREGLIFDYLPNNTTVRILRA